jgi:hypothetical protein
MHYLWSHGLDKGRIGQPGADGTAFFCPKDAGLFSRQQAFWNISLSVFTIFIKQI